jgi:hypothetical protein
MDERQPLKQNCFITDSPETHFRVEEESCGIYAMSGFASETRRNPRELA